MNGNEQETREYRRRASDTYVPISLVVTASSMLAGLLALWFQVSTAIVTQENRMTKIEAKIDSLLEKAEAGKEDQEKLDKRVLDLEQKDR